MNVALVRYVEYELVFRSIENQVHRHGELDDSQIGTEVSAVVGSDGDQAFSNLCRKILKLVFAQGAQFRGLLNFTENRIGIGTVSGVMLARIQGLK